MCSFYLGAFVGHVILFHGKTVKIDETNRFDDAFINHIRFGRESVLRKLRDLRITQEHMR